MNPLLEKRHISELKSPGDFCFVNALSIPSDWTSPKIKHVILSCPFCGLLMVCGHKIISEQPLSLSPSIVGPENSSQSLNCNHHFHVEGGVVKPC